MKTKNFVSLTVLIALISCTFVASALGAIKSGATCTKVGSVSTAGGMKFTCIKVGKKLIWDAGNIVSKAPATSAVSSGISSELTYKVGDITPEGGTVFYVAKTEMAWGKYLEFAPFGWVYSLPEIQAPPNKQSMSSDPISSSPKCANLQVHSQTSAAIGAGKENSAMLLKACDYYFIHLATSYRGGGLDDWYLPSINELVELCKFARGQITGDNSVPCTASGTLDSQFQPYYLSSTGDSQSTLKAMYMISHTPNLDSPQPFVVSVTDGFPIRPIRAFTTSKTSITGKTQTTDNPYPNQSKIQEEGLPPKSQDSQTFEVLQSVTTDPTLKMKMVYATSNSLSLDSRLVCNYKNVTYGIANKPNDMSSFRAFKYSPLDFSIGNFFRIYHANQNDFFMCVVSDLDQNYVASSSVAVALFK